MATRSRRRASDDAFYAQGSPNHRPGVTWAGRDASAVGKPGSADRTSAIGDLIAEG